MQQPFTLNALGGGQSAVITAVHGTGEMHARLRDLGFTEESRVTCLFSSAFGDPRAYRVKDTNGSGRRSPKRPAGGIWADKEAEGLWDAGSDALWSADRRSVETKEAKEPGTAAGGEP